MGWIHEAHPRHEGYLQVLFADGAAGSGIAPGGVPVHVAPDGSSIPYDEHVTRPRAR